MAERLGDKVISKDPVSSHGPQSILGEGETNSRIKWLDGWRAVAIFIVIASHAAEIYDLSGWNGKFGVYIFFAISGYIVTKILYRERKERKVISLRNFYRRRILRIIPPLFVYMIFCCVIHGFQENFIFAAARSFFFTCNIRIPVWDCGWEFGHTWSLAFEEQYYLIIPLLLAGTLSVDLFLMLGMALALAAMPLILPIMFIGKIGFFQIYGLLGLGAVYALKEDRLQKYWRYVPTILPLAALFVSYLWMFMEPSIYQKILSIMIAPLIVFGVIGLPNTSIRARAFLSWWPIQHVGLYSYTLYLWQQLALTPWPWNTGILPIVFLIGAFAVSVISYYTIEQYARDFARK